MKVKADAELHHDPVTGDWIVIAPRRARRPASDTQRPIDPFSAAFIAKQERVIAAYGRGQNRISVIENKFPVFVRGKGTSGYQEILVEGTRVRSFTSFTPREIENVLRAYAARARAIRKMYGMKSLIIFKNEGREAGASQPHPHSQLFALSFVPKRVRRKKIAPETIDPRHVIWSDRYVTVFAHPFARFPYETRILTQRKIDNLAQATQNEIHSLAKALARCLSFVHTKKLAYNFSFHDVFADRHEHFEIRFIPRANVWGGFELDAGISINSVPAEQAAEEYRQAFQT